MHKPPRSRTHNQRNQLRRPQADQRRRSSYWRHRWLSPKVPLCHWNKQTWSTVDRTRKDSNISTWQLTLPLCVVRTNVDLSLSTGGAQSGSVLILGENAIEKSRAVHEAKEVRERAGSLVAP